MTSVFIDVLTIIWSILVVKYITKISDKNGFNNGVFCLHVYILCF